MKSIFPIIILLILLILLMGCENKSPTIVPSSTKVTQVTPEIFAEVDKSVGNITFTASGDLVYSHHPFFEPAIRMVIMDANTKATKPFPNLAWNTPRDNDEQYLSSVLGVRNDENGIVWMIDMALRNDIKPKIVGWNTKTDMLERIYYIDQASVRTSQQNDMVVDTKHKAFIIADEGIGRGGDGSTAAFIIVDMVTGETRRILEGHRTTLPENMPIVNDGKTLAVNGKPVLVGNDGITSDKNFEWIYYGPLNGTKLYRIKTVDLLNKALSESDLDSRIELYSEKVTNGGLSIDMDDNIYLTALETKRVAVVLASDKSVQTITSDDKMIWPDGVSYNNVDEFMYVSASQVNLGAVFNDGTSKATQPFYIFRFKPIVAGVPFR